MRNSLAWFDWIWEVYGKIIIQSGLFFLNRQNTFISLSFISAMKLA